MLLRQTARIEVSPSFSLKATVLSHGWHECVPMSWSEGGSCFQVIERLEDQPYRLSVTPDGAATKKPAIRVTMEGIALSDDAVKFLHASLGKTLALDRDLSEFYELCEIHPRLKLIPKIGGGRLVRSASMTENVIKFLCSTNVNWTQAVKMINRLAQLGPHPQHFRSLNAWPSPREILRAGREYLTDICRVGYRADSILLFCRSVDDGLFDPDLLVDQAKSDAVPSDDIIKQLREIKGIGPASAHSLLSLMGRYDRVSVDSATIAHAAAVHFKGTKPTPREVEKVYEPYGKWKNLVYWCESWITWGTARQLLAELNHQDTKAPRKKTS